MLDHGQIKSSQVCTLYYALKHAHGRRVFETAQKMYLVALKFKACMNKTGFVSLPEDLSCVLNFFWAWDKARRFEIPMTHFHTTSYCLQLTTKNIYIHIYIPESLVV